MLFTAGASSRPTIGAPLIAEGSDWPFTAGASSRPTIGATLIDEGSDWPFTVGASSRPIIGVFVIVEDSDRCLRLASATDRVGVGSMARSSEEN